MTEDAWNYSGMSVHHSPNAMVGFFVFPLRWRDFFQVSISAENFSPPAAPGGRIGRRRPCPLRVLGHGVVSDIAARVHRRTPASHTLSRRVAFRRRPFRSRHGPPLAVWRRRRWTSRSAWSASQNIEWSKDLRNAPAMYGNLRSRSLRLLPRLGSRVRIPSPAPVSSKERADRRKPPQGGFRRFGPAAGGHRDFNDLLAKQFLTSGWRRKAGHARTSYNARGRGGVREGLSRGAGRALPRHGRDPPGIRPLRHGAPQSRPRPRRGTRPRPLDRRGC